MNKLAILVLASALALIAGRSVADFTRTKDAKMAKAAKKLTPADVADLAACYEKLPK